MPRGDDLLRSLRSGQNAQVLQPPHSNGRSVNRSGLRGSSSTSVSGQSTQRPRGQLKRPKAIEAGQPLASLAENGPLPSSSSKPSGESVFDVPEDCPPTPGPIMTSRGQPKRESQRGATVLKSLSQPDRSRPGTSPPAVPSIEQTRSSEKTTTRRTGEKGRPKKTRAGKQIPVTSASSPKSVGGASMGAGRTTRSSKTKHLLKDPIATTTSQPQDRMRPRQKVNHRVAKNSPREIDSAGSEDESRSLVGTDETSDILETEIGAAEGDEEQDTINPALHGQDHAWSQILEGARANCFDRQYPEHKQEERRRPIIKTQEMQTVSIPMKHANMAYKIILDEAVTEERKRKAEADLLKAYDDLTPYIHNIREFDTDPDGSRTSRDKGSETIEDILCRGVPDLVYLLRTAIGCRSSDSGDYDYDGMKEIIRIQDLILRLCQTAYSWTKKPPTGLPIIKPIRSKVFPYMKNLRLVFGEIFYRLEHQRNIRLNRLKASRQPLSQPPEFMQDVARFAKQQLIKKRARTNAEESLASPVSQTEREDEIYVSEAAPATHTHHGDHRSQWTEGEDEEILTQLQSKSSRLLPIEERCLEILNAPLLQNKLPEHIRARALYFKPLLLEELSEDQHYYIQNIT